MKRVCNFCGRPLNKLEDVNTENLRIYFFYGSKYDGDYLKFSLCSTCYDNLADDFVERCRVKPEVHEAFADFSGLAGTEDD